MKSDRRMKRWNHRLAALAICVLLMVAPCARAQSTNAPANLRDTLDYISQAWGTLTRSMSDCKSVYDPKAANSVLYLPAGFAEPAAVAAMEKSCSVRIEHLPVKLERLGQIDVATMSPQGLLYLDHPYVVPGGRFNEQYGWDSYFIVRGLVEAGRVDLARDMVENFFFEIDHYGGLLNANRTYYLTRSQPPFLTSMILSVYDAERSDPAKARAWLQEAFPYAVKDYQLWIHAPHLAGSTGLARYYDFGKGPAPESLSGESNYYRHVAGWFAAHPPLAQGELLPAGPATTASVGPLFALEVCNQAGHASKLSDTDCEPAGTVSLSPDYFEGDRSMRESGFDVSFRFGPFGGHTHDYAPVGLNSLLYETEKDLAQISRELGKTDEARQWAERAAARGERINKYLWNAEHSYFFDYDFATHRQSSYHYLTTFYPLWVGLATKEQAAAVERNVKTFEHPGGLAMSDQETGAQWDYPYGWAPVTMLAIEGLRRYGFDSDANRLSKEFLSMVVENFRRDHTIREKYNVVTRSSETHVEAGYTENAVGFGWTNAAFLVLLHQLPPGSTAGWAGVHP
jgi:alpha,alpha-trehalase